MKRIIKILFTVLCMLALLVPSVGTLVFGHSHPVGNESVALRPSVTSSDGSINVDYIPEMGAYFEKRFAFRPEAITADSTVLAKLFRTSSVDTVAVGKDGWMYYTDSLNDYAGRYPLSDRELGLAARNLKIIQEFCEAQGIGFLFTIAPNKNTLYGEHMPFYANYKVSDRHNRDGITAQLEKYGVHYCDLFTVFKNEKEVLYFRQDSHWNNKGALLAYDTILTDLGQPHDDYADAAVSRKKNHVGDLSAMLYPASSEPEFDYDYGQNSRFSYVTNTRSVEDATIITHCDDAEGSLYMYRDSFGNALLPFMAGAYADALFTKAFNKDIAMDLEKTSPDVFIMELVERNLDWLITMPPLIQAKEFTNVTIDSRQEQIVEIQAAAAQGASRFLEVKGTFEDPDRVEGDEILIRVTDTSGNARFYQCYGMQAEADRGGFLAYLPIEDYAGKQALSISLIIGDKTVGFTEIGTVDINVE
ncbi:MAG: hypothetical protein K6A77_04860 [Clostridiales bacterium]|nr:hypothetical protein [Clostridiales bacterium]